MGPCRTDPRGAKEKNGVCGATADVIVARNLGRMVAAGAAAHSNHEKEIVNTLLLAAEGNGYEIKGEVKLMRLAEELGIDIERDKNEIARDLALEIIDEFGMKKGKLRFIDRPPEKRTRIWNELRVLPRGIDREVVEMMHRTHMGGLTTTI
jgi:carbon-monoxide dehydrogenase catalytic subunit